MGEGGFSIVLSGGGGFSIVLNGRCALQVPSWESSPAAGLGTRPLARLLPGSLVAAPGGCAPGTGLAAPPGNRWGWAWVDPREGGHKSRRGLGRFIPGEPPAPGLSLRPAAALQNGHPKPSSGGWAAGDGRRSPGEGGFLSPPLPRLISPRDLCGPWLPCCAGAQSPPGAGRRARLGAPRRIWICSNKALCYGPPPPGSLLSPPPLRLARSKGIPLSRCGSGGSQQTRSPLSARRLGPRGSEIPLCLGGLGGRGSALGTLCHVNGPSPARSPWTRPARLAPCLRRGVCVCDLGSTDGQGPGGRAPERTWARVGDLL